MTNVCLSVCLCVRVCKEFIWEISIGQWTKEGNTDIALISEESESIKAHGWICKTSRNNSSINKHKILE